MTDETQDDPQDSQDLQVDAKANPIEDKARGMGWVPKEEFKGDPAKWRPADEFVQRGENYIPILKSTVEKQERVIADLQEKLLDIGMKFSKVEKRAYEKALADIEKRQELAVETGDKEAFNQAKKELKELEKDIAESQAPKKKEKEEKADPVFDEWVERNKWFKSDKKMHRYANFVAQELRDEGSALEGKEFLDEVAKEVKAKFPEKFENPKRNTPSPVEGSNPRAKKSGSTFADLPAKVREDFEKYFSGSIDKEKYAKRYFAEVKESGNA